jgi:hypothetical protein
VDHDHVGRAIQPIVGGTTSGADQDAVVLLARFDGGARQNICTATLVASNLVVTARHCVSRTDGVAGCAPDGTAAMGAGIYEDYPPSSLFVFAAKNGVVGPTTDWAMATAHGKTVLFDPVGTICNHDVAFIVLDHAIDGAAIAPMRIGPPASTDVLTAVGFGLVDDGTLPQARMQRSGVALLASEGPWAFPDDPRFGAGPSEAVVGESACSGDSGSPLMAKTGAIVGVASRAGNGQPRDPSNAASTCTGSTAHVVYTHLDAEQALITRAFAAANATPWLEGEPDPRMKKDAGAPCDASTCADAKKDAGPPIFMPMNETVGASGADDRAAPSSSGCAAAPDTHDIGAFERAAGVVALLATILRARRRLRRPRVLVGHDSSLASGSLVERDSSLASGSLVETDHDARA